MGTRMGIGTERQKRGKGKERMAADEVVGLKAKVCLCGAAFLPWLLSFSRGVGPQPFTPRDFGLATSYWADFLRLANLRRWHVVVIP